MLTAMDKHKREVMGTSTSMEDSKKKGWEVTGNTDMWELLCKAVNHDTGEYHSTKMLLQQGGGCVLQCDSMVMVDGVLEFDRSMVVMTDLPLGA